MDAEPLSLIVPVYNEAANFPNLVREVGRHAPHPFTLNVVYDFDADTTVPVAREFAASHPWLRLVKNQYKGVVGALRTGFEVVGSGFPDQLAIVCYAKDVEGRDHGGGLYHRR